MMISRSITLTNFEQLEKCGLIEYLRIKPLVQIVGSYIEDKTEKVFQVVLSIAHSSMNVRNRICYNRVVLLNGETKSFVSLFNIFLGKAGIQRSQFDYKNFLNQSSLELLPQFQTPTNDERTALSNACEFFKSEELEVELVSFLLGIIEQSLWIGGKAKEIVLQLKNATSKYPPKISQIVETAEKIFSIKYSPNWKHELRSALKIAKKLARKNFHYLKLVFGMIPEGYRKPHQPYIISSLIDSKLGVSTRTTLVSESKETWLTPKEETCDLDLPISKGEMVILLLMDFEELFPNVKIRLNDLIDNADFARDKLSDKEFDEKQKQFLAKFSLRAPFPQREGFIGQRLLADYFVEATLEYSNTEDITNKDTWESISNEIRYLLSEGASRENAWNYVIAKYKDFGFKLGKKYIENLSSVLISMGVPISENALPDLLFYEHNFIKYFRAGFDKDIFNSILNKVIHKKIAAMDFTKKQSVLIIGWHLAGISKALDAGAIPSPENISELITLFNFLRPDNQLSYIKGIDYPKEAHRNLQDDQIIQSQIAHIKEVSKIG